MKYVKILGLAAIAAMALMAFAAGTASATTLTKEGVVQKAGTELNTTLTGSAELLFGTEVLDTCTEGSVSGKTANESATWIESNGEVSVGWGGCTRTTDTLKGGNLKIMWTSGNNGEVVSSGAEVTVGGIFNTSCVYGTETGGTKLGTLEGTTSGDAKLVINTSVVRKVSNLLCPGTTTWKATYLVTAPTPLAVVN